jgi:phage terminase large subunit
MSETVAKFPPKLKGLFNPARYKVLYGGRGSGKSYAAASALLIEAAQKPLRVLCAREVQKSLKQSVHTLLVDQIQTLNLGYFYTVTESEIRGINGSVFTFSGLASHTVESIKSMANINRCWIEEAQTVSKKSWEILIPTIRANNSEIWITMNPDLDTDETYVRFVLNPPPDTFLVNINWVDNPWFPLVLEKERQHCLNSDPKSYANIWDGKPKTVVDGAIYADEFQQVVDEHRIAKISHDPILKTHVVMDLGWADKMAIIMVQRSGSELRIIDYIEESYKTLDYYSDQLKQRSYNWGTVFMPHDAVARDFKTGKSAAELMTQLGWNVSVVPMGEVEGGIRVARLTFSRCWFDKEKTERLLECLKRYRRAINSTTGQPQGPLHDEASHGADAFRYMCLSTDQMRNDNLKRKRHDDTSRGGSWMSA